jgi:hypothetical protein
MKRPALLAALSLTSLACAADGSDDAGGLGSVALNDSADASGKFDDLMGRQVTPEIAEEVVYGPQTKVGKTTVTALDEQSMTVEAPLVAFGEFDETLQVTVSGGEVTDLRFFLVQRPSAEADWEIVTVEGQGVFEDGTEPDEGMARSTPVVITYFQSVSILADDGTITVGSDGAGGQTTTALSVDPATAQFGALVLPVDSGAGNTLLDTFEYELHAQCDGAECGDAGGEPEVPADDYAQARDVDLAEVTIGGPAIDYTAASVGGGFGLGGTEFWQKWPGGHSPSFSYAAGTEAGRKCMLASAIRFEAIMSDPPASMVTLLEQTNWSGRFFNWNDDFTEASTDGARGAVLWAWRTSLIKWISQTGKDGTCYLPTLATVEAAAANCLAKGQSADGEIEGCQAR